MRSDSRFHLSGLFASLLLVSVPAMAAAQQRQGSDSEPAQSAQSDSTGNAQASALAPEEPGATKSDSRSPDVPDAPDAPGAAISGTVTDTDGDLVPGATVSVVDGRAADRRNVAANDNAFFELTGLKPGIAYHVEVSAPGFDPWISQNVTLSTGQFFDVTGIKLRLAGAVTSVTVVASPEQIATEQVHIEEQQRVLGFIPNFYVVYDSQHAVPMTTKLKFQMAFRVSADPITIIGAAFLAGINQAADTPDYRQGSKGYGERFAAVYADGFTDTMFGGAILPSLLHQDPRYFYQGTGTVHSRLAHALSNPVICKGDNGHWQPNYSSIGGDLISSAISTAYYPHSNAGFVFQQLAISTAERAASSVLQEFVVRIFTPSAKRSN